MIQYMEHYLEEFYSSQGYLQSIMGQSIYKDRLGSLGKEAYFGHTGGTGE